MIGVIREVNAITTNPRPHQKNKQTNKNKHPIMAGLIVALCQALRCGAPRGFRTLTTFIMGCCSPDSNLNQSLLLCLSPFTFALSAHPPSLTPIFAREEGTMKRNNISLRNIPPARASLQSHSRVCTKAFMYYINSPA